MPREIGDIFISIDHAKMQAEEYGHSFYREMCFLFTHGYYICLDLIIWWRGWKSDVFKTKRKLNALNIEGNNMDQNKLIDLAWKARENAYVPYSHFKVGALLL